MRAGGLRNERIILQKPVRTTDKFGAEKVTWEVVRTVRAERVKMSGRISEEVGERFPGYSVEFNIRYPIRAEEHWRVLHMGGNLYEITNVIPNRDRQMKTLVCERVNE